MIANEPRDGLGLRIQPRFEAIDLDDQHGTRRGGEAEVEGGLDGADHEVVEHLERRRDDPGRDDAADRLGGGID